MKKFIRWAGISLVVLFLGLQLIRPAKTNPAVDESRHLLRQVEVPAEVAGALDRSCFDCHSNQTRWPWYSHVAPVSWFVIDHVNHGRQHLNFSDWAQYSVRDRAKFFEGIRESVEENAMPLSSYTLIHKEAVLSDADKKRIGDWAAAEQGRLAPPSAARDDSPRPGNR